MKSKIAKEYGFVPPSQLGKKRSAQSKENHSKQFKNKSWIVIDGKRVWI